MAWSESDSLLANCTFCKLRSILQVTNMSMGEAYLLWCLPSEVRVHIFCLALGRADSTSGALLWHWLNLALVSQDSPES